VRADFPFLRDPSCPPELKILIADKITAYHNYTAAHYRLFEADSLEKTFEASREIVENYLNNQSIYKELNHYREKGVILGEHPIFDRLRRMDEIRSMRIGDLVTLKIRLENNLVRNRKKLRDQLNHPDSARRAERVRIMELELTEVNRLLNIDAK